MHAPILIPSFPHFLSQFFKEPKSTFPSLRNSTLAVLQFQDSYAYELVVNFAVRTRYIHDTLLNQTRAQSDTKLLVPSSSVFPFRRHSLLVPNSSDISTFSNLPK